jgi:hypothetical protein
MAGVTALCYEVSTSASRRPDGNHSSANASSDAFVPRASSDRHQDAIAAARLRGGAVTDAWDLAGLLLVFVTLLAVRAFRRAYAVAPVARRQRLQAQGP